MSETIDLNRLPFGNPDFALIRKNHKLYVDKTKLIYKIASQDAPIFLSRPRRFGKSLLVNTLHCLFYTGLEYFHGLDIEKVWNDKTYKVVHLDFSSLADKDHWQFMKDFSAEIIEEFGMRGIVALADELGVRSPDRILSEIAKQLPSYSVVLLIDEYDAPLTHNINESNELKKITAILNNFYSTVKQYTGKFRLIFITGVTRASHVSIFSAFNNLKDLSLRKEFNSFLGFTAEELQQYFVPYVENAAKILNVSKTEVYQRLEQYYDGFQFSIDANETVYNPWSIINFFDNPQSGFKNYWFKSGGTSSIIMQYLKISESFDFLNYNDRNIYVDEDELSENYEIDLLPRHILLYQAGYFTLRNVNGITNLVLPNEEVEESLLRLYLKANNLSPKSELTQKMKKLANDIDTRNLSAIVNIFNDILNECVSALSNIFDDERSIRDIIYAALIKISSMQKLKEHETVKARSDLELITNKTCMVIEFKRTYPKRGPEASFKKALEQLKISRCGLSFSQTHSVYRVGMVISTEEKMILHDYCKEVS